VSSDELFLVALLKALKDEGLEAIIVGTVAAVLHGAPIATQDVDLLIRDTPRNREKLKGLAAALGAHPLEAELALVTLLGSAVPVDVVLEHLPGGLGFESVRARSMELEVGGETARVASLEDVIASKRAANRAKDRAQLPILVDTLRVITALLKGPDD
jgi:predicted nucleotidyltransferase